MTVITQQELESYLWGAAVLLRGTIDAGDYKQFIFPLLFYKRLCDVYDEETRTALEVSEGDEQYAQFPENHRFQIPSEADWRVVRQVARDVGGALQNALRGIEIANPEKLYGIFGDAQWTNKDRLSDAMLRDLIEHFGTLELTLTNLPEDELGRGYEYLIKQFADDSGHTAAEFYTNRTVVHLMTELLQPQPGESIYDPTCGSGGMLLSCIAHLRRTGQEWRNVRLYGQERNLMTSSIARMNLFLHGIEDFRVERGDTLADPKLVRGDRLHQFDLVLANPPYSIKQWDREAFATDPWGRNRYGTPPQSRADYAFWQHILASLAPETGRCAILFPHGVLFRQEEAEMRCKLIEADLTEAIIGLGPNLFYNSPMEACIVICRTRKPDARRGRVLFVNAVDEVARERAQSLLAEEHIARITGVYKRFADEPRFAQVATLEQIRAQNGNLSIPLYVSANGPPDTAEADTRGALADALEGWLSSRAALTESLRAVLPDLPLPTDELSLGALEDCALFDRAGWQRVRFGDVVKQLKEKVDPESGDVERYVAGEHMDTEDVHIRRWGTIGGGYLGPAFIRRFRKGQVLYGSRRTYLKKVAVAEWDGVTANTTFVLQADERCLLQALLPWLMLSESFTQHSVKESRGSTNPYINFPDIAEFDLPPMEQQRRIAAMLWAVDEAEQFVTVLVDRVAEIRAAKIAQLTSSSAFSAWPSAPLVNSLEIVSGQVDPREKPYRGMPLVAPNHVDQESGQLLGVETAEQQHAISGKYLFRPGDVVYAKIRPNLRKCFIADFHGLCSADMYPLRPRKGVITAGYLLSLLVGEHFTSFALSRCTRTGIPKINRTELGEYVAPLPGLDLQEQVCAEMDQLNAISSVGREHRQHIARVKSGILAVVFGDV